MKRLVYAPKAYVFVRSSNIGGRVFNVTSDVVSGSVTRNVNDLSTAQIVLRNRYFKWIVYNDTSSPYHKMQIFLPMDMISIWLQRIAGAPIQVFTGYLDSVPYYQMYPGNCILTASCTLKRLAFQWFDPGLSFFIDMVDLIPGWFIDPGTGDAINFNVLAQSEQVNASSGGVVGVTNPTGSLPGFSDGGFAEMLYYFMTIIAAWPQDNIVISKLPRGLSAAASLLYSSIDTAAVSAGTQLENAMALSMGSNFQSSGTNADGTAVNANSAIAQQIANVAGTTNAPPLLAICAALCTTNFTPGYDSPSSNTYGLYAMQADDPLLPAPTITPGVAAPVTTIEGMPIDDIIGSVAAATAAFGLAALKVSYDTDGVTRKPYVNNAYNATAGSVAQQQAIFAWLSDIYITNNLFVWSQAQFITAVSLARNVAAEGSGSTANNPNPTTSTGAITWSSSALQNCCKSQADQTAMVTYGVINGVGGSGANDVLAGFLYQAKQISPNLMLNPGPANRNPDSIYIASSDIGALTTFTNTFLNQPNVTEVLANIPSNIQTETSNTQTESATGNPTVICIRNGQLSNVYLDSDVPISGCVMINQQANVVTTSGASAADPNSSTTSLDTQQYTQLAADSAFAAQFTFPINIQESLYLTGAKALMNDTSCLDAVQQFCQASMRNFMSLPDGRFLAFYPDYFGAHGRKPYWYINDIEILDMGIQLNDDSLATHVYVVGDAFAGQGTADSTEEALNDAWTRGVATVLQLGLITGFTDPNNPKDNSKALGMLAQGADLLRHYGERPHMESEPLLTNPIYEFLLAWQRFMQLWATQFATNVSFTFQPEIFAGGLIGFNQHNLQVYVESVTHTFDYINGFYTDAVISSPAELVLSADPPGGRAAPAFALAGNINTVAAGTGD